MRLYVSGSGSFTKWATANTLQEAQQKLGPTTRTADDDDCRAVWMTERVFEMSEQEIREKFGVTRQTADLWRRRGGSDLPMRQGNHSIRAVRRILKALDDDLGNSKTKFRIMKDARVSAKTVEAFAEKMNYQLAPSKRRPSDEELIELQRGRTWHELANVVGIKLCSLRHYVYSKPELSKALRAVRASRTSGLAAHGLIPIEKIRELYEEGVSAYRISILLQLEQMTVRYWIRKWTKEDKNEQASQRRKTPAAVAGSNKRAASKPRGHSGSD